MNKAGDVLVLAESLHVICSDTVLVVCIKDIDRRDCGPRNGG